MFYGLLGRKFNSKCKTLIKTTKTRLETIRKKKAAVQKYLKNDVADLLKSGFDYNAYGRAEGLLIEMNMASCYEFIEQFCGCISNHLSAMHKQRECPEECREAVPSLMFAAARFADLPELRDLRNLFTEKYGNSLEPFVNQEFIGKLKQKHPTKEMKLQLLQDIAQELSIEWDSKALEQKLYTPPPSQQDQSKIGSLNQVNDDGNKWHKSKDEALPERQNQEDENKHKNLRGYTASNRNEGNLSSNACVDKDAQQKSSNSVRNISDDDADKRKPFSSRLVPPPYVKQKEATNCLPEKNQTESACQGEGVEDSHNQDDAIGESQPKPKSVRRRFLRPPPVHDNVGNTNPSATSQEQGLQTAVDTGESTRTRSADRARLKSDSVLPPAKTISLPPEPTTPTEAPRGHARAISLQPDMLNQAGHVHPKLPDYDSLAALLAARRGM